MKRHRPAHVRIAIALLVILVLGGRSEGASNTSPHAFSILSYNVHGVFRLIAKDAPGRRSPTIGWLANRYDVVLLQEDFEYHGMIAGQMQGRAVYRGNGMRLDPRLLAAKLLLFPVQLLLPHFSPPYGAGVTAIVDTALVDDPHVAREAYGSCKGWFASNGDCWATKGFLRVRIRLPNDAEVDLYNTHLDAGAGEPSRRVRGEQLEVLAARIEALSPDRALIIAGDLNSAAARPGDWDLIMRFRDRLRLHDSGAGPELPCWRERDYILYRSGGGVTLAVDDAGEAVEFVSGDRALSDHAALFAGFRALRAE